MNEVLSRREENSKTYDLGAGKYRTVIGGGIAHYKDAPDNPDELWKDVDATIIESDRENWDWEVVKGKYHILIRSDTAIAFGIDGHWVGFRYDGFGYLDWASKNHVILGTRQAVTPVVSENTITWSGIFGAGTSLEYVYTSHRLQTNLYIEQSARNWLANNPPSKFGLSNQTSYLVGFAEMDWQNAYPAEDIDGNTINWSNINEFIDGGVYWRHPLKDAIVNAMPIEYAKHDDLMPEEWVKLRYRFYKHEDKHYLLFGAHVLDLNAYPEGTINLDPTFDVSVTESAGYRRLVTDYWALSTASLAAGALSSSFYKYGAGMRFQNITIGKSATIDAAKITFKARQSYDGTACKTRISAEKEDNPAAFADDKAVFDTRWGNRSTAKVDWDNIDAWTKDSYYDSPEIKTVIQEIVNRSGWASGNAMVIFWEDFEGRSTTTTISHIRDAYNYGAGTAPTLYIEYTPPYVAPRSYYPHILIR